MINTVLSLFNLGTASVALGLCRAAVATTEITGICADFMVVDAVLPSRSPADKIPANREKNREKLRSKAEKAEAGTSML
jgi:hypothetical protein